MTTNDQTTIAAQRFPVSEPSLYDVLQLHRKDIFASLRVCVPAKVVSFSGSKHTASVSILLNRLLSDGHTVADYPQIDDVPVLTSQGGGAYLQFPIAAGDQGILIFADRNIRAWMASGAAQPLPTLRMHSLSDGFFIPGINALNSSIPITPINKAVLSYQGAEIDLASNIVTIKNATTTLMTLLNSFITAIEGIEVTGNLPLTAPSVAALETVRTELEGLLA